MILIDEILVSREITNRKFVCKLTACKGACCIEGDYGAPLEDEETHIIEKYLPSILSRLPKTSANKIKEKGFFSYNKKEKIFETELMDDGACVFMGRDKEGITFCGIEKTYNEGDIDFKKPISCHLYPVRVLHNKHTGFEALNYDEWEICSKACHHGEELGVRVYEFVKDALIRKYGEAFYEALDRAANHTMED